MSSTDANCYVDGYAFLNLNYRSQNEGSQVSDASIYWLNVDKVEGIETSVNFAPNLVAMWISSSMIFLQNPSINLSLVFKQLWGRQWNFHRVPFSFNRVKRFIAKENFVSVLNAYNMRQDIMWMTANSLDNNLSFLSRIGQKPRAIDRSWFR